MLFVIFTYEREQMLKALLDGLDGNHVIVIDDGSKSYPVSHLYVYEGLNYLRTIHEGKQGFWKKWLLARQIALGTDHEYFCFLNDDLSNIDLEAIQEVTKQGWIDRLFALNVINCGDHFRWGQYRKIQEDFKLAGRTWSQCDYVDGNFITNRATLQAVEIEPVKRDWFDRPDKSSGVGFQMTMKLRALGCPMMLPDKSLAYHGDHDSVMHPEHRKTTKLISK